MAKNFQVNQSVFMDLPCETLYMFKAQLPRPLQEERMEVSKVTGYAQQSFSFYTNRMQANVTRKGISSR